MNQDTLNTTEAPDPKFDINQEVKFDKTGQFDNSYNIIEGEVKERKWDSDRKTWLYHISTVKHGETYHILFIKEKHIREGEDFYEYHKKREES